MRCGTPDSDQLQSMCLGAEQTIFDLILVEDDGDDVNTRNQWKDFLKNKT